MSDDALVRWLHLAWDTPEEELRTLTAQQVEIIVAALNTVVGGPSKLFESARAQIHGAIHSLVDRAIKNGDIRPDLDPFDLLRALVGVSNVASVPDWPESARRLVDILIAGSRPTQSTTTKSP